MEERRETVTMNKEQSLIKLDLDGCVSVDTETIRRRIERAGYSIKNVIASRQSPSGKGWHVVLEVEPRPKSPYEVVALQAICGSDPYREAMQMNRARNFFRAPAWMRNTWNVLYLPHPQRHRHIQLRRKDETVHSEDTDKIVQVDGDKKISKARYNRERCKTTR